MSDDDQRLLGELTAVLATIDAVPAEVVDAARESFVWRTVDAELAELAADSVLQPFLPIRSAVPEKGPRLLTFEAPGLTIEVEVTASGERRRLLGQLVPPQEADVEVRWRGGNTRSRSDAIGRFLAAPVPAGAVSIACTLIRAKSPVVTSWVTI